MSLTKSKVEKAVYRGDGKSWDLRYDGTVPGFALRVSPGGTKTFVLRYRSKGRTRLATVGRYGVYTVQQARDRAKRMLVEANEGRDPVEERQRERAKRTTVRKFADTYIDQYAKVHKSTWKEDRRRLDQYVLPALGSRLLVDVRKSDVVKLHAKIAKRHGWEANRVLALLSTLFNQAKALDAVPADHVNPAVGIKKAKEPKRSRRLQEHELPAFAKAVEAEPNPWVRGLVWLLLFTGCRRSELLGATWSQVNMDRGELTLPTTKSGEPRVVALSTAALAILSALPRASGNDFVFPGHRPGQPLRNVDKNWAAIRRAAGLSDLRMHDLRRSLSSMLRDSGADMFVVSKALGHSDISVTAGHYIALPSGAERQALEAHGQRVLRLVEGGKAE